MPACRPMVVEVVLVLAQDGRCMLAFTTRMRSSSSGRMLPTNRSPIAFARGDRTGILIASAPVAAARREGRC